jgi:hypothetical protein
MQKQIEMKNQRMLYTRHVSLKRKTKELVYFLFFLYKEDINYIYSQYIS